ncbi:hypothetical protein AOCH_002023 [Aspergillus ochraceoroseus]|nr:hypothetical protein AOCH_002023 [Aspergillus ochraceoroseus]
MVKIFIQASYMGQQVDNELNMYKYMEQSPATHPGRDVIRTLLDTFYIDGPQDKHRCLVHPPLWESVLAFLRRNPIERLPSPVIAVVLHHLFLALDYLHTECHIAHTDIKADNIMFGIKDDSVFTDFEEYELQTVISVPWTFSADIWNVGCMIWDIYEGGSLFTGQDPEFQRYRSRAHLAEMINLLGPPPPSLVIQGELSDKFFSSDFLNQDLLTGLVPLEQRETTLEGTAEREAFLRFMRKMLQWEPGKRSSAKELAEDEWIHRHM